MGTSTGYGAPTSPQWEQAKRGVTQLAKAGVPLTGPQVHHLLAQHIAANGGARGMAGGSGVIGGKSAQAVAQQIGGFISRVGAVGLNNALREAGLDTPESKSGSEILRFLADYLGGSAATTDDADARDAAAALVQELLKDAEGEEVERVLTDLAEPEKLAGLLETYFTLYLYEQFCRVHFERLVLRVGDVLAGTFLGQVKDLMRAMLRNEASPQGLQRIDWHGPAGVALCERLCVEVLTIFGG